MFFDFRKAGNLFAGNMKIFVMCLTLWERIEPLLAPFK